MQQECSDKLTDAIARVKKKAGKALLSDEDLMILAADAVSRTVSYEEQQYGIAESCKNI